MIKPMVEQEQKQVVAAPLNTDNFSKWTDKELPNKYTKLVSLLKSKKITRKYADDLIKECRTRKI